MTRADAVAAMLDATSVAVVGASARADSFGAHMTAEVLRGAAGRRVWLVNPKYDEIDGRPCVPSLDELDDAPDLVLLGVPDSVVADELARAAACGARSAVVFGSAPAPGLRERLRDQAERAGMALCGAGCMGFVNVPSGLRAVGYVEPDELPAGPVSLVTHSGSIFSTLLRARRAFGFTLAVSSGQELVTTTADYVEHALDRTATRVLALVAETVRDGGRMVALLRRAADAGIPVVVLPVAGSAASASMVAAHSGALAGSRAMWEALAEATGALLVSDLAELADLLELLTCVRTPVRRGGIATVHDSGAERSLVADLGAELGVPFAPLTDRTRARLGELIEPGLTPDNPLDVWGTGARTRDLFRECLRAMTADATVALTALAVDLVPEFDGDTSYPDAVVDVVESGAEPVAVLTGLGCAVDGDAATRLRRHGVPVLEGFRSGLTALRLLLDAGVPGPSTAVPPPDRARQARWRQRLRSGRPLDAVETFRLLDDYGIPVAPTLAAGSEATALHAARSLGYPVVIKTAAGVAHKTEARGVRLGIADDVTLRAAYADLSAELGPQVSVSAMAGPGVELALGVVRDPHLGPLVVVGAGGITTELVADRAVALPPLDRVRARRLVRQLRVARLLDGWRGAAPTHLDAVLEAVVALGALACELGDDVAALDVNPLIASPGGVVAVDALVEPGAREAACTG